MIVVDTNLIVHLLVNSQNTPQAGAVFKKDSSWVAPVLWKSEFCNVLVTLMRSGQLSSPEAGLIVRAAENLMRSRGHQVPGHRILSIAAHSSLSAYDCEFVALAQDLGLSLVTVDRGILRAFPEIAVSPRQYAA